jgi:hypothetical protein
MNHHCSQVFYPYFRKHVFKCLNSCILFAEKSRNDDIFDATVKRTNVFLSHMVQYPMNLASFILILGWLLAYWTIYKTYFFKSSFLIIDIFLRFLTKTDSLLYFTPDLTYYVILVQINIIFLILFYAIY